MVTQQNGHSNRIGICLCTVVDVAAVVAPAVVAAAAVVAPAVVAASVAGATVGITSMSRVLLSTVVPVISSSIV